MTIRQFARLYRAERARFGRAFPVVRGVGLALASKARGVHFRSMAYTDGRRIVTFYADALDLPVANLRGLIRHELGHVAAAGRAGEQLADDLAELATGRRIRYDRRDLETTGGGRWPRPLHLHRNPARS